MTVQAAKEKKNQRENGKPDGVPECVYRADQVVDFINNREWEIRWLNNKRCGQLENFIKKGQVMFGRAIDANPASKAVGNLSETRDVLPTIFSNNEMLDVRYAIQFTVAHICSMLFLADHDNGIISPKHHIDRLLIYVMGKWICITIV